MVDPEATIVHVTNNKRLAENIYLLDHIGNYAHLYYMKHVLLHTVKSLI